MIETTRSTGASLLISDGTTKPAKVAIRTDPRVQAVVEQSREAEVLQAKAMDQAMGVVRHSDDAAGTS